MAAITETLGFPNILAFGKKGHRTRSGNNPSRAQNSSHDGPSDPGRRKLIIGGIALATTAALYGIEKATEALIPPHKPSIYDDLVRYKDMLIPQDVISKIGKDLKNDHYYLGFSVIGDLINQIQEHPEQLKNYYPVLTGPVDIRFSNIIAESPALAILSHQVDGKLITVKVRQKETEKVKEGVLVQPNNIKLSIVLDNKLNTYPEPIKRLVIVRQFSELLYLERQKEYLKNMFKQSYDLIEPQITEATLGNFLQMAANTRREEHLSLGEFDKARIDLTGASYFHILIAYAEIKMDGSITSASKDIPVFEEIIFQAAMQRGLLIVEPQKRSIRLKEGLGPFSPEWTKLVRSVLTTGKPPQE